MTNNIGMTSAKLSRTIGETTLYDTTEELNTINLISGNMDVGAIIFDTDGTMGVCTKYETDSSNNPLYTIETKTLNTEIDIQSMLSKSY